MTSALVRAYIEAAAVHGNATEAGDYRRGNKAYERLVAAFRGIVASGAREMLLTLLVHEDRSVRAWAATHSLRIEPKRSVEELSEIAEGGGPIAFDAGMVLAEWKKGTLRIEGEAPDVDE